MKTGRAALHLLGWTTILAVGVGCEAPTAHLPQPRTEGEKALRGIFEAYGGRAYDDIEWIAYRFSEERDSFVKSRAWRWHLKTDDVDYFDTDEMGNPVTMSFNHREVFENPLAETELRTADHRFVHDSYWILFPYRIGWDRTITVTYDGLQRLPIGNGEARRITIAYPLTGGYDPGTRYRLYCTDEYRVLQWSFILLGDDEDTAGHEEWSEQVRIGRLILPILFVPRDNAYRRRFSDVAVKFDHTEEPVTYTGEAR